MPYLIINIVNKGTPAINPQNGLVSLSFAGHMWYAIQRDVNSTTTSYGFAPIQEGSIRGPGNVNPHGSDSANYVINPSDGDYQSQKIYITQEQYNKLDKFGSDIENFRFSDGSKFDMTYNGLKNSCIDFTWKALDAAGLNPTHFEGDLIPSWNIDNVKALENYQANLENGIITVPDLNLVSPSDLGLNNSQFVSYISDYYGIDPVGAINSNPNYFSNTLIGLNGQKITAHNSTPEDLFGSLKLTLKEDEYFDSNGNLKSSANNLIAETLSTDGISNITITKDDQSVVLKDGSTTSISSIIEMTQDSISHLNKFIFNQVSEFANSYQKYLVDNKEQMVGDIIARVLLGESLQEAMVAVAQVWGVNALLNNQVSSEALNGIISNFSNDTQITAGVQAGVVAFLSTVLIAGLRGDGLNGQEYTEAGIKAAAIGAVAYFMPSTPVGPIIAILDGAIQGFENRGDLDRQGWQDLGTSTAAAVASATVGLVVGMEVGSAIGSAVFPGFGTIVGAVVGALVGAILYQPLNNLYHDAFEANEEIYDAIEDTIIKIDFSINNLEENARQIARAVEDIARAYTINLVGDIFVSVYNLLGGHWGKTYKPGEYPDPYSFIQIIPKADGTGNQIFGLEREGTVLIASENGNDDIFGTQGQDIMIGKAGKNTILGYGGNDHIEGRSNDDILVGGQGDDEILGGLGDDYLSGSEGADSLFGGAGDDAILGGDGNDYIEGGVGNDQIEGEAGSDYIEGNEGDDIILGGAGNDIILGDSEGDNIGGNDTILGEDGDDIILAGVGNDIVDGGAGNDVIEGGAGNDNLKGNDGNDTIYSNDGVDIIYGDSGSDIINAGADNDLVFGGIGNDVIFGSSGNDSLYGEIGNDYILGGDGDNTIDGGADDDVLIGDKGNDTITMGEGNDTIIFLQNDGQDIIDDTYAVGSDIIRLADTNSNKIILSKDGNDLILQFKDQSNQITTDKITIKNEFNADGTANSIIDRIEFADGKTFDLTNNFLQTLTNTPQPLTTFDLRLTTNIDTAIQTELALGYQENFQTEEDAGNNQTENPNSSFYDHNYDTTANQDQIDNEKFNEVQWHSHKKKRSIFGGYYNVWTKYYEQNLNGTAGNDRIVGNWWSENINGGAGDDQLSGNDGNDNIYGGTGNDLISGGTGNDRLYGEAGNDKIYGGTGNDYIDGGADNDDLIGNEGDDTIFGQDGDDRLNGNNGNDNLNLGTGNNIAYGGAGIDTINSGNGKNFIDGGDDNDMINAGSGDDYITANSGNDSVNAGDGNNQIFGNDGSDFISAGSGDDYISGGSGDDVINAGNGNNEIYGNLGNDQITTGSGIDYIYGGSGVDAIKAGANNDVIYGNSDGDWIEGEAGNDSIYGGTGSDNIFGGDGNDIINGNEDGDVIYGGKGNDQLFGNQGNDILIDDEGSDILDGGADKDIIILTKEDGTSTSIDTINNFNKDEDKIILKVNYKTPINFAIVQASMQQNGADVEINLDNGQKIIITNTNKSDITEHNFAIGLSTGTNSQANQILFGTDGDDTLFGDQTDNTIYGGAGNDELWGGLGSDALYGQEGNDILRYEADGVYVTGNNAKNFYNNQVINVTGYNLSYDIFNGGNGQDVILMTEGSDVLDLEKPVTDQTQPKVRNVGAIYAGNGNDIINFSTTKFSYSDLTIYGGDGDDKLWSNSGNDRILGGEGNDEIYSGRGDDNIDGGVGDDVIYGGDGNDTIFGSEGNDIINGEAGNDIIVGGSGTDFINGGDGVDTISYSNSAAAVNIEIEHDSEFRDYRTFGIFGNFSSIFSGGDAQGDVVSNVENIIGSAYDDVIIGSLLNADNNQITGGAGNDILSGGLGNDIYCYNLGDGSDVITENDSRYNDNQQSFTIDSIKFGAGIIESDLHFSTQGNDLIIQIGVNVNDKITIKNQNLSGNINKIEYLIFDNGNSINLLSNLYLSSEDQNFVMTKQTLDYFVSGTILADVLSGNVVDNRIYGNAGNDILRGDAGSDIIFGGDNDDTIYGNGLDTINVSRENFDWQYYLRANEDLASNLSLNTSDAAWNHFQNYGRFENRAFSQNINLYYSNDSNKLYGESGNDAILGGYGDDQISGGIGNDNLKGNFGDDTIFGDVGNDRIQGGLGNDILDGGDGVDTIFGGDGNDIINSGNEDDLAYGGTGNDQIGGGNGNDSLYGEDGNDIIYGDVGNDYILGGAGNDQISGSLGNDILSGEDGNDIYVYNLGDGIDIIRNSNIFDSVDRIKFGLSISVNNLILVRSGNDLIIMFKNSDHDQIKVENHFGQNTLNKLDYIEFNDGSLLDLINLTAYRTVSSFVNGTSGSDNFGATSYPNNEGFFGDSGNDIIQAGKGDDVIKGGSGDDIIYGGSSTVSIFEAPIKASSNYGSSFSSMSFDTNPRELADVNGDGRADIVAFANDGAYVSLANNDGTFGTKFKASNDYGGPSPRWYSSSEDPRILADINGDGRADIIGYASGAWISSNTYEGGGVYASLGKANGTFSSATYVISIAYSALLKSGDINGDGYDDLVFFFNNNLTTYASFGSANGLINRSVKIANDFNINWSSDRNPRELADVNGDGKADIIGFADDGVYVSLAGTTHLDYTFAVPSFSPKSKVLSDFGYNQGWTSNNINIRKVVDINGDGKADIVGFGNDGVYVSMNNGNGTFSAKIKISDEFGVNAGWVSNDQNTREVIDINGDGKADIIGFKSDGTYSSLSYIGTTNESNLIYGDSGNDALYGSAGNDILNGGLGSDIIDGKNGNDTIIIDKENGFSTAIDTINNFDSNQDKIVINVSDQTTFISVQSSIVQVGSNVKITLNNGQQIIVTNINKSNFNSGNLIINNDPNHQYDSVVTTIFLSSIDPTTHQPNSSSIISEIQQVNPLPTQNSIQPFQVLISASHGIATISNNGNINYIPNANFSGVDQVTYQEKNSSGVVIYTKIYNVFVAAQNDAPTTNSIANQEINPEQQFSVNLSQYFADADNDNLQYTVKLNGKETLPNGISFNQSTKTISGVSAIIQNLHFEITASDGKGGFVNNSFDINVIAPTSSGANIANNLLASFAAPNPANTHQPVLSAEVINQISHTTYIQNEGSNFSENITADQPTANNFVDAGAGNDNIKTFAGNDIINAGTGNDKISSGTGNDIITGGTGSDTFVISTGSTNGETTITDFEFNNSAETIDISSFIGIRNLSDLTITAGSAIIHLPNGQTIHILNATPENISASNFQFAANQAPTANNINATTNEDSSVSIDVLTTAADIEGDILSINNISNPTHGTAQIITNPQTGHQTISYIPNANYNGTDSFNYTISDGQGGFTTKTLTLQINPVNDAPEINTQINNQSIISGSNFNFTIPESAFVDIDSVELNYNAKLSDGSNLPSWLTFNPTTKTLSGTAPNSSVGTIELLVIANDGSLEANQTFTLNIQNNSNQDTNQEIQNTITGTNSKDTLIGTNLNDQISGGANADILYGGLGNDTLLGGSSDDILIGGEGSDILDGGTAIDTASYNDSNTAVNINLLENTAQGGTAEGDTFISIENITGSNFNDNLTGNNLNNVIDGGSGNDIINGGAGNDKIIGGAGADIIDGGDGIDTVHYTSSNGAVNINLSTNVNQGGTAQGDILINIENITGSDFSDNLTGDNNNNLIYGGAGNDNIFGQDGNDTLYGGANNDIINGDNGNDKLIGDTGNDILIGGAGVDNLTGGAGRDTFVFNFFSESSATIDTNNIDTITDFKQGEDQINLHNLNLLNHIITFDENPNDDQTPEGLSYHFDNDNNTVIEHHDNNPEHEFVVKLMGKVDLGSGDFGF